MARKLLLLNSIIFNLKSFLRDRRHVFICNSSDNTKILEWYNFCIEHESFIINNGIKFILPVPSNLNIEVFTSLRHSNFILVPFEELFKFQEDEQTEFDRLLQRNWRISLTGINKILEILHGTKNKNKLKNGMHKFKVILDHKNVNFEFIGMVNSPESLIIESANTTTFKIKFINSKISFINTSSNISIIFTKQQSAFLIFEAFKPIDLDTLDNSELYFKKFNLNVPKKMSVVHSQRNQLNNKFENLGGLRIKNNFGRFLTSNCTYNTFTDIIYNLDDQTRSSLLEVIQLAKQL